MKSGIELIAEERKRQIENEGWTADHDAIHNRGELAKAAACYCLAESLRNDHPSARDGMPIVRYWPFSPDWWKPSANNRIKELQKAGALIAAEIDRLNSNQ